MSHQVIDLGHHVIAFPVGTFVGEKVVLVDDIDVGDWEEGEVEVHTLSIDSSPPPVLGDVKFNVETCIDKLDHANWQKVAPNDGDVDITAGGFQTLFLETPATGAPWNGTGLRKWARLYVKHNSTTSHRLTVHVSLLLKKRNP